MTQPELPSEVRDLLQRALPTMSHVEALLLLARSPSRSYLPPEVATALAASEEATAAALDHLVTARLVETTPGSSPPSYRFSATDAATVHAVSALQEMYDRRPVTLVKAVYDRPPTPVTAFADAFRVRPRGGS